MIQDVHNWGNIHDAARGMGVTLNNHEAWWIGDCAQKQWMYKTGTAPVKDNRTKKIGTGSHCFALYPPAFLPYLESLIRSVHARREDQPELPL